MLRCREISWPVDCCISYSFCLEGFFRLSGISLVIVTLGALIFVRSDSGRILTAIRDNETRCDRSRGRRFTMSLRARVR
jgi:hypothetical protein